ncbi:IS481 family transposase, partial [Blastococcus sp. TF02A-26]|uniref:IS481 family transposase n=1 Tax=Blastococcus sp. TF02A-26 TaxID=2250577 RepID=UPI000DEA4203
MVHRNAPLTETGRLRLARCIVDDGWPVAWAAQRFQVSRPTATRWRDRYLEFGPAGMVDRSSRPHSSPRRTPQSVVRRIVHLRWKQRLGPVAIAARVGLAPSTVHRILVACRINRLWHVDRVTGEPIRRYEMARPGELVHVDVKKLGNIPDGGGWRAHGRAQGNVHRHAHRDPARPRKVGGRPNIGYCYVHSAIDGYTRLAYSEALDDETAATALAFWARARAFFAGHGITVERVLTDNGSPYVSHAWRDAHQQLGIKHSRTRVRRPQTNGKVERLNRTLLEEWAYKRLYTSEKARRA